MAKTSRWITTAEEHAEERASPAHIRELNINTHLTSSTQRPIAKSLTKPVAETIRAKATSSHKQTPTTKSKTSIPPIVFEHQRPPGLHYVRRLQAEVDGKLNGSTYQEPRRLQRCPEKPKIKPSRLLSGQGESGLSAMPPTGQPDHRSNPERLSKNTKVQAIKTQPN